LEAIKMTQWCPKCNAMLPPNLKKCPRCGKKLPKENSGTTMEDIANITLAVFALIIIPLVIILLVSIICVLSGR
jgi:hypothetical protein